MIAWACVNPGSAGCPGDVHVKISSLARSVGKAGESVAIIILHYSGVVLLWWGSRLSCHAVSRVLMQTALSGIESFHTTDYDTYRNPRALGS